MLGRSLNRSLDLCARRATGAKGFSLSPGRALKVGPSVIILIQGGERHEGDAARDIIYLFTPHSITLPRTAKVIAPSVPRAHFHANTRYFF